MDKTKGNKESAAEQRVEAHREVIRLSLDEIAVEVEAALREANLTFPIYLVSPNTGGSIITVATLLDPPDIDWSHAAAIVCRLVGNRLGKIKLSSRHLQCSVANAQLDALDVLHDLAGE